MPTVSKIMDNSSAPTLNHGSARDVLRGLIEKQQIIGELIEGKVSLREAAGRFQVAHHAAGDCLERTTGVPSRSLETENTCRSLIGWVRLTLKDRPERADRVTARLEEELSVASVGGMIVNHHSTA